jgi:hypothetical protein
MSSILVNSISPYSGNSVSFTNNANVAGSFSAVTYLNLPSSTFTGGTIDTLNANVVSATTFSGNISDTIYTVNYGLNASGTTINTGSICGYGVNVFIGVTNTNYATKLPQPVTGKSVKIINLSNSGLSVFPSNVGGTINNNAISQSVIIPPDGKLYEFVCVVNPLPGAWVWSAPATNQYDSGEILIPLLSGTTKGFVMADSQNVGKINNFNTSTIYAYEGRHKPLIINEKFDGITYIQIKPSTPWLGLTKIKIYTNLADCEISGTTGTFNFQLMGSFAKNYYATGTTTNGQETWLVNEFIGCGDGNAGTVTTVSQNLNKVTGSPLLTGTSVQENIGDPGTYYGEYFYNLTTFVTNNSAIVGDYDNGEVLYPNANPSGLENTYVDEWSTGYISLQVRPMSNQTWSVLDGIKVRFFIEYYN